ncbi:MAG: biotin-dependent carboxyltransferase family protein [Anaerolineae bacterium]
MLQILDAGLLTTVQDGGRVGWARYGIPPSGPMDPAAFAAANHLVGNPPNAAGLEITLTGPLLRTLEEGLIGVCGAEFELWVGGLPVPTWHSVFARAGSLIRFGQRVSGLRAYLAIAGGLRTPSFLGSQSTYLNGEFGGLEGRALRAGDRLTTGPHDVRDLVEAAGRAWPRDRRPAYSPDPNVRVILGPQDDHFPQDQIARFFEAAYEVTPDSDRMGLRLRGTQIEHLGAGGIVSDGIVTGSVQIPPDGQPIVMMVDHQTTGGYPKIGTVIRADLPLLAQCLPGDRVRFTSVELK